MSAPRPGSVGDIAPAMSGSGPRWPYAVSGLLAAAAGIAAGHLVAAWTDPATSPVVAVGTSVIDATPPAVKDWAIGLLGTADKAVLLVLVLLVTSAAAAGLGLVSRTHRRAALLGLSGLVALSGLAAVRVGGGPFAPLPALAAGVVGLVVLTALTTRADRLAHAAGSPVESPLDHNVQVPGQPASARRRQFVLGAGAVGVGSLVTGALGQALSAPLTTAIPTALPPVPQPLGALPEGVETTVRGVSALRTPTSEFYRIDTALVIPRVSRTDWRLTVDGMVDREVSVGFDELVALGLVERDITLNCVSNEVGGPYIGATRWTGVPARLLLERAGVRSEADQVLSTSVDGMTISTPVEALLATGEREALVAIGMDGIPLPARHGFPARLVTPGLYGYVGAPKWVTRLTLTTFARSKAYWSTRGWAEQAPVQIQARIDTPRSGSVGAGQVAIAGVAWAQAGGGITRVEVRIDDRPWQDAQLGPVVGPVYWRQWWLPWEATKGRHRLTVRATDATGVAQTDVEAPPAPSGATGWHTTLVSVT